MSPKIANDLQTATHSFGWLPDLPDQRDYTLDKIVKVPTVIPSKIDNRKLMPPVYDQGQLGSCTANAIAAAVDYERKRQGEAFITPSRLFIYYNERAMEGTVGSDAGAAIRDGIKSVDSQGDCPEKEWPYVTSKLTDKPSASCYSDALKYKVVKYASITHTKIASLRTALVVGPVVFGFTVYESFESTAVAKTGNVPMPLKNETVLDGHAVVAVGYDDSKGVVICRNSWGASWGDKGYFYLPYAYVTGKLASDFWAIRITI
jgi:C1A family cysteine protease